MLPSAVGRDELVGLRSIGVLAGAMMCVLLLVGGHPVDLVGDDAVLDAAVRGLDEAVLVDAGVERERADQADVGAFGGLDRAHAA